MNVGSTQAAGSVALPVGAAPGGGQAFWDVGGATGIGGQMAPDHEFSELVELDTSKPGSSKMPLIVLAGLLVAVGGWFAFETFVAERDPFATLKGYVDLVMGHETAVDDPVLPRQPKARPVTKTVTEAPVAPPPATAAVAGNPYWTLPNKILGPSIPMKRAWAPEEEETLRAGLSHHFAYQRYKTVMDIRQRRLIGSDAVLWDAMQDKKLWTRMFAAIGLAEFNVEISLQSLEGAMNGARSELLADFFERFMRKPKAAELFVMRQVVRLLDEKGRLIVLQAIANSHDSLRDVYLMAATQDPGARVQSWIARQLGRHPISVTKQAELLAVVNGTVDGGYLVSGMKAPLAPLSRATATNAPTSPMDAPLTSASEEDLEKEMQQFQTSDGDVEFYDDPMDTPGASDAMPVSDQADPDTFDYEE